DPDHNIQRRNRRNRRAIHLCAFGVFCVHCRRVTATLPARVLAGEPRAIAGAISLIEDEDPASADLVRQIFAATGRAYLIGVTGPPGAGKSTLVDRLVTALRPQSTLRSPSKPFSADSADSAFPTVGVIAVDPTS